MLLPRALLAAVALLLATGSPAAAQAPPPAPEPAPAAPTPAPADPPPAPTPTPAPAPATGSLRLAVTTGFADRREPLALRGRRLRAAGRLRPAVAGQAITVTARRGRRTLATRTVRTRADGRFRARLTVRRAGRVRIRAVHRASPAVATTRSPVTRLAVLAGTVGPGDRGRNVRVLQRGLNRLRYAAGTSGRYDDATARAILAWRKVNGRARVSTADAGMYRAVLRGRGAWKVRHPGAGKHVEAVLSRQAFALVVGRRVVRVLPTSSGAPATPTILGRYRFYRKDLGTNAIGMVDAAYFIRGYAIHGYVSVPTYNASHGCLRVAIASARYVYDWVDLGDRIFVEAR